MSGEKKPVAELALSNAIGKMGIIEGKHDYRDTFCSYGCSMKCRRG